MQVQTSVHPYVVLGKHDQPEIDELAQINSTVLGVHMVQKLQQHLEAVGVLLWPLGLA